MRYATTIGYNKQSMSEKSTKSKEHMTTLLSYEELANTIEDAWEQVGLHDHGVNESINTGTLERTFRAEIFPEHGEPLTDQNMPPWAEVSFTWGPDQQRFSTGGKPVLFELGWNYTITLPAHDKRSDVDLLRAFTTAIHQALRKVFQQTPEHDVLAVEIRRVYKSPESRELQHIQLFATGASDISDTLAATNIEHIQAIVQEELVVVASFLRTFAEIFSPGTVGGYRSVESA